MQLAAVLVVVVFLLSFENAAAQGPPERVSSDATARVKPTAAEKRCLASRRRVERQREVIEQADARIAKERAARESCKTKRACDSLDRALNASETRQRRHAKQLAQFESEAAKACAAPPGASTPTTAVPPR